MTEPLPLDFQLSTLVTITDAPAPEPVTQPRYVVRGDEELEEYHYQSRTSPANMAWKYQCTPSVFRYFKEPIEKQGDFRTDISPLLSAYCALNGEDDKEDPNTRYLFNPGTGIFNTAGYPQQAYITMSGNELRGEVVGDWFRFETLTPRMSPTYIDEEHEVQWMTYATHPHFVHRFDLVCWSATTQTTRHHPNTPRGILYFYLMSNEGFAWIPARYVKQVER